MRAFITGGTRGVGKELVNYFLKANYEVLFTARKHEDIIQMERRFSPFNKKNKPMIKGIAADFSDKKSVTTMINEIETMDFRPSVLIHNAGYLSVHQKETLKHKQKLFMVNAITPIMITESLLPKMEDRGHILFFSPPYSIDEKMRYLNPYMQSKLAQTTYMKSLSYLFQGKKLAINSIWTNFPLWTDAISKRDICKEENCMHPAIISKLVEEIIRREDTVTFKGNEIIDKEYFQEKGIDIHDYKMGNKLSSLDNVFLNVLNRPGITQK